MSKAPEASCVFESDAVAHRDDFLGIVAHDVRNLLNLVVLTIEHLDEIGERRADVQVSAPADRIPAGEGLIGDSARAAVASTTAAVRANPA